MNKEMLENASSIRIDGKWIRGVIPDSVKVSNGWITFECTWSRARSGYRRFTIRLDEIDGVEEGEE